MEIQVGKKSGARSSRSGTGRRTLSVMVKGRPNHGHVTAALLLLGGLRAVGRGVWGGNQALAYNPDSVGYYLVDWAGVLIFLSLRFLN